MTNTILSTLLVMIVSNSFGQKYHVILTNRHLQPILLQSNRNIKYISTKSECYNVGIDSNLYDGFFADSVTFSEYVASHLTWPIGFDGEGFVKLLVLINKKGQIVDHVVLAEVHNCEGCVQNAIRLVYNFPTYKFRKASIGMTVKFLKIKF